MYAVIRTGGKQYCVEPNSFLEIERLSGEKGDSIELKDVLLVNDGKKTIVGSPVIEGACVHGEIVEQHRGEKLIVFKKIRTKGSKLKKGHRQELTRIKVKDIVL